MANNDNNDTFVFKITDELHSLPFYQQLDYLFNESEWAWLECKKEEEAQKKAKEDAMKAKLKAEKKDADTKVTSVRAT